MTPKANLFYRIDISQEDENGNLFSASSPCFSTREDLIQYAQVAMGFDKDGNPPLEPLEFMLNNGDSIEVRPENITIREFEVRESCQEKQEITPNPDNAP